VSGHKLLEDVHEDSMQFPSQNNRFLCNHPDGTLKASGRPSMSRSSNWEGPTRRPDDVATRPGATHRSRIFRVSVRDAERSDSFDRPDIWSSRLDAVLFWEELRYSGKVVAEDCPDAAK
jgi:hypothetical protein